MVKAVHARSSRKSYTKRISDHVAVALIIYTLLLIFMVMPAMETEGMSILPLFLLVVFVALMIPFCRHIDKRWKLLEGSELSDSNLRSRFAIDRTKLWIVAIGAPVLLAFLFGAF
ncbi:MAG: hypothetical protein V3V15_01475 [Sphingorhabdus sp.]